MARPASKNLPKNLGVTLYARLLIPAIDHEFILKSTLQPGSPNVISNRGTTFFDGIFQYFFNAFSQLLTFLIGKGSTFSGRVNACGVQRFIGVDITNPADNLLV